LSPASKFKPVSRSSSPPLKQSQRAQSASFDPNPPQNLEKSKKVTIKPSKRISLIDDGAPHTHQQQPLSANDFVRLFHRGEEEMTKVNLITETEVTEIEPKVE